MSHYPLVGIGGIDESTIQAVAETGVGSVAVVRAITGSDNPEAAVKRLTQLMRQAKSQSPLYSNAYSPYFAALLLYQLAIIGLLLSLHS
jgi:hypothetical protein